jgi:hypothetical protein
MVSERRLAREGRTAFENDLQTESALAAASGSPHRGSAIIADDVIPGAFIQVRHEAHSFDLAARAAALDLQRRCNRAVKRRAVAYIYSDDWSCVNGGGAGHGGASSHNRISPAGSESV